MPNQEIGSLTAGSAIAGTEVVHGVQGGNSRRFTFNQMLTFVGGRLLRGTINPTTEGADGDFYLRSDTSVLFGPKAAGSWPSGVSLIGAAGTSFPTFSSTDETASYTAVSADFNGNRARRMNVAGANNFTVNSGLTTPEPLTIIQMGAGQTTIVAGASVTINSSQGLRLRARYSAATLIPVGTDIFVLSGDTAV